MNFWANAKNAALIDKVMGFERRMYTAANRANKDDNDVQVRLYAAQFVHPQETLMREARLLRMLPFITRASLLAAALWTYDDLPEFFRMNMRELRAIKAVAGRGSVAWDKAHYAQIYQRLCHLNGGKS